MRNIVDLGMIWMGQGGVGKDWRSLCLRMGHLVTGESIIIINIIIRYCDAICITYHYSENQILSFAYVRCQERGNLYDYGGIGLKRNSSVHLIK